MDKVIDFKGYQVDECGHVVDTLKSNKDCFYICCSETSGHLYNIVGERKNDVQITFYQNLLTGETGSEVYFYKPGTYDHYYSRNYCQGEKFPGKYSATIERLKQKHIEIFS